MNNEKDKINYFLKIPYLNKMNYLLKNRQQINDLNLKLIELDEIIIMMIQMIVKIRKCKY